jgi:hypothetical protein
MDPFRLCLALGPVAVYVLLIGALNLARRPLLVGGNRDAAALGLALSGMAIVGPLELFFPHMAAARFGPVVWILLVVFYALCLVLVLLLLRPRLVVYNISVDQIRPILADVVDQLDHEARWAGDTLYLPNLDVQLYLDDVVGMRNVSLISLGPHQSHQGWRRLEQSLGHQVAQFEVARNPWSLGMIATGMAIAAGLGMIIAINPEGVAESLFEMLKLR